MENSETQPSTPVVEKVITFPKIHRDTDADMPLNSEEAKLKIDVFKKEYSSECTEMVYENAVNFLRNMGFGSSSDLSRYNENDYMMLFEAISSITYRYQRMEHFLHDIVDDIFIDEELQEGSLPTE